MKHENVIDLILQSLEHERGGIQVYTTALECVQNEDLREEWEKYLEETKNHEQVLLRLCEELEIDPEAQSPGRPIVKSIGMALVAAMKQAKAAGNPAAAEIVACECVTLAETKDHLDWELIGQLAEKGQGDGVAALREAYEEVEDQEDEHLYHSKGWCRELWIQALGMKAVLPPPEERKHVKTAIGAARAEQERGNFTRGQKPG
jgi:rubrerythrin